MTTIGEGGNHDCAIGRRRRTKRPRSQLLSHFSIEVAIYGTIRGSIVSWCVSCCLYSRVSMYTLDTQIFQEESIPFLSKSWPVSGMGPAFPNFQMISPFLSILRRLPFICQLIIACFSKLKDQTQRIEAKPAAGMSWAVKPAKGPTPGYAADVPNRASTAVDRRRRRHRHVRADAAEVAMKAEGCGSVSLASDMIGKWMMGYAKPEICGPSISIAV